jgi:hypothetical protein
VPRRTRLHVSPTQVFFHRIRNALEPQGSLGVLVQVSALTVLQGKQVVTQVPTLQKSALAVFALLTLLLGMFAIRRLS